MNPLSKLTFSQVVAALVLMTGLAGTVLAQAPPADMTDGEIRKVDKSAKKLTIRHGDIKNLDMPGMTMVFQVKDLAMLDLVKAGDKVKFKAEKAQAAISQREDIKGAVFISGKRSGFMAGGDLKEFAQLHGRGLSAAQAAAEYGVGSRVLRELETCGKPVVAALNGTALGSVERHFRGRRLVEDSSGT